ncbi:hypothetical protein PR048_008844 [Dryococelus australis]|uniref:Uncharacterized protein n=1 Tax=Dryococelus australis TaxID=614101 RepID=A0ABQ9HZB5_9NEOP|nr:hypothetical protein PR048_008844 [Dryococelus australis]
MQSKVKHELHLRKIECARTSMKIDANKSKNDNDFYVFTFDMAKSFTFPINTTSVAYYKRNIYVYNLGCHELTTGLALMYVWDETIASRGLQEVSSCVIKHNETRPSRLNMYSDTCTALSLLKLGQKEDNTIDIIEHKFMVSGHSYLLNDADFVSIETYSRGKKIYVPDEWYSVTVYSQKKPEFHLIKVAMQGFKSSKHLEDTGYTTEKRDISDLLPFIPPIHHSYFHNLLTTVDHADSEDVGPLTEGEDGSRNE